MLLCNDTIKHTAQSRTKTRTLCGQLINMTTFNVHNVGTAVPTFNQLQCLKPYGEVEVQVHTFILALDRQEWLPSRSSHFTPSTT